MIAVSPLDGCSLGVGLYSPADAALYARVKPTTMKRWVFGDGRGSAAITNQIPDAEQPTVSFVDFVQAMAVRAIRTQYNVPLQKIREAVDYVQKDHGIECPFARDHRTFVIREGSAAGNLVIDIKGKLIQISGKNKTQQLLAEVAELYLDRVTFGPDGLANEYRAWGSGHNSILMNPHLHFGEPVVTECGYSARVLYEAVKTEGSIKGAAQAYGVEVKHIRLACEYFDFLINRDAA